MKGLVRDGLGLGGTILILGKGATEDSFRGIYLGGGFKPDSLAVMNENLSSIGRFVVVISTGGGDKPTTSLEGMGGGFKSSSSFLFD